MTALVVVTGGSAGIGRAVLEATPYDDRVAVDVSRSGGVDGVEHLPVDLADPRQWPRFGEALAQLVERTEPDRVVVVHAAGTLSPIGYAAEVDHDAYDRNAVLNAAAPLAVGARALAVLAEAAGRSTLCLLSSGAATSTYPGWSSYCGGKAAVDHWVRVVGLEQRERGGVEVLAVAPGVVDTGMQELIRETDERDFPRVEKFRDLHRQQLLRTPERVAQQLWTVIEQGVESGTVLDLRDVPG